MQIGYSVWGKISSNIPGGGVLLGILGGSMSPASPNPDPILDQEMSFFTPVFRPGLYEIMSSLPRSEHQQK